MYRTSQQAELVEALTALGLGLEVDKGPGPSVVTVAPAAGSPQELTVVALASPSVVDVDRLVARHRDAASRTPVLVADRLVPRVREELSAAGWGWLDRRGHLRLVVRGLAIDADVPSMVVDPPARARPVLDSVVGLAVASASLTSPHTGMSVRTLVSFTGHSLGAVHEALRALKAELLLDAQGLPAVPELFWEVAARWRPRRFPLRDKPSAEDWALCDTMAAMRFGAPVVARGDHPPDYYVSDERSLRAARHRYADAVSFVDRAATVALSPIRWALARSEPVDGERVVHPVVAALDLAVDRGRGREILDQWDPPDPYARVW